MKAQIINSMVAVSSAIFNKMKNYTKILVFMPTILCLLVLYRNQQLDSARGRLEFETSIYEAENRILEQEVRELENKPTYEDGYKDAIVRSSGSWGGDYQAGFRDAYKLLDGKSYADGYHEAIAQFSYQTNGKELVPKPTKEVNEGVPSIQHDKDALLTKIRN